MVGEDKMSWNAKGTSKDETKSFIRKDIKILAPWAKTRGATPAQAGNALEGASSTRQLLGNHK